MEYDIEYIILQQKYRNHNHNNKNIFPSEWYNVNDYILKKKILNECISNNILIVQSSYYYLFRKRALNSGE